MPAAARNPWVATDVVTDPFVQARNLQRVHERSVAEPEAASSDVRELVADSWKRSLAAGVAPDAPGAPVVLDGDEIHAARVRSPLGADPRRAAATARAAVLARRARNGTATPGRLRSASTTA
jgi:hypothetical protein